MGLVAVAGFALAMVLAFWNRDEQAVRLDLESYHLRSAELASSLRADLADLRAATMETVRSDRVLDAKEVRRRNNLAAARQAIRELESLEGAHGAPAASAIVESIAARFERIESQLARDRVDARTLEPAFASFSLALEQLGQRHAIDARTHIAELERAASLRNRVLLLLSTIFFVAVLAISLRVFSLLGRSLEREQELRASLERTQRTRLHTIKMEALGRLASGVAHDFNNCLQVILAHVGHIQESLTVGNPLQRETEGIGLAIDQAGELVQQLLKFGREGEGELAPIDLSELTLSMESMLARLDPVRADPREIERVLINLVSNAGDAIPAGGTVTIETAAVRAEPAENGTEPEEFARLSVFDTGVGMASDVRERVFEPFFTTKDEGEGTGLGLSTAHGIVTKLGGRIEIDSSPKIGTRVDIYLPFQAPRAVPEVDVGH
jgi:signal transduction histidine kinase